MKRIVSFFLLCSVIVSLLAGGAFAQSIPSPGTASPQSSEYFAVYSVTLSQGSRGHIELDYLVASYSGQMYAIGVSKIQVYKTNGTLYQTIAGNTTNGLLEAYTGCASGTYPISCVSGTSYYCMVTIYARNANGSDTRVLRTGTVTCP